MTLDEARKEIEKCCRVFPEIGNHSKAPTGELYINLVCGGLRREGEVLPYFATTPELAVKLWFDAAWKYVSLGDILYWRVPPCLDEAHYLPVKEDGTVFIPKVHRAGSVLKLYQIYSRLLVSDKPVIMPAQIER